MAWNKRIVLLLFELTLSGCILTMGKPLPVVPTIPREKSTPITTSKVLAAETSTRSSISSLTPTLTETISPVEPSPNIQEVTATSSINGNIGYQAICTQPASPLKSFTIAYTARVKQYPNVFVIQGNGSAKKQLTFDPVWVSGLRWSPDGKLIALNMVVDNKTQSAKLYVMKSDGSGMVLVSHDLYIEESPAWSPDGQKIAFGGINSKHQFDIYTVNSDGSELKNLTHRSENIYNIYSFVSLNWSRDGKNILYNISYHDRYLVFNLFIVNSDGTNFREIKGEWVPINFPQWNPRYDLITLVNTILSTSPAYRQVFVMNPDGSNLVQLTTSLTTKYLSLWSPNGSMIAYEEVKDANISSEIHQIHVMNRDGTKDTSIISQNEPVNLVGWTSDNRYVAIISFESMSYHLYLIDICTLKKAFVVKDVGYIPDIKP